MVLLNKVGEEGDVSFLPQNIKPVKTTNQNIEASFVSFFCILQIAKVTMP